MRSFDLSRTRGFTLVELAVVVAVIALLLGSLLVPLTTQVEQRNTSAAQKQLDEVREALIGFALVNGRLPRPAMSMDDGREKGDCVTDVVACTGYLPWTALGLSKTDAWGKMLRYSVVPEFAADAPNPKFGFSMPALAAPGYKQVRTRDQAGTVQVLAQNLVAVVLSYGGRNFGTTADGQAIGNDSTVNADESENDSRFNCAAAANCTDFFSRTQSASQDVAQGGDFDDIVVWVPRTILFSRMVQAGQLP
jgi:prepilin-type N-terminal cleavage/methylation domain-containing protein